MVCAVLDGLEVCAERSGGVPVGSGPTFQCQAELIK